MISLIELMIDGDGVVEGQIFKKRRVLRSLSRLERSRHQAYYNLKVIVRSSRIEFFEEFDIYLVS